ncbi:MAG TPA: RNA pseudouridine synthase [Ramlibacter sp.]|jgi:23S rRNA pseudouridine2604 synthase|nr:RNA pseudouridine synthase [Ramlibacter sp.]
MTPSDDAQRLSKVVAALVPCSRREAEQYIVEGWVRVDGQRVEEPQFRVADGQRVEVDPKANLQPVLAATFLLHKPAGVGTEDARELLAGPNRWSGDASGIRPVKTHRVGLVTLMPLPVPASGLVVFSQDRGVVRKLTEEAAHVEQELVVEVAGTVVPGGLERLGRGVVLEGQQLPPVKVSWQSEKRLRFAGKGIRVEALPAMCALVGLQVVAVRRLRIGRVGMAGLPAGAWKFLGAERF